MDPTKVLHGFLEGLLLKQPRVGPGFQLVPVARQHPRHPASCLVSLEDALLRGLVEVGPAGVFLNHGPSLVVGMPGTEVLLAHKPYRLKEPCLIPPRGEALLELETVGRRKTALMLDKLPEGGLVEASEIGGALFVGGKLVAIVVLEGPALLGRHLWRLRQAARGMAESPAEITNPMQRTRRLVEQCWYAELHLHHQAGRLALMRIHAPQVSGWGVLAGDEMLVMELMPEAGKRAGIRDLSEAAPNST